MDRRERQRRQPATQHKAERVPARTPEKRLDANQADPIVQRNGGIFVSHSRQGELVKTERKALSFYIGNPEQQPGPQRLKGRVRRTTKKPMR